MLLRQRLIFLSGIILWEGNGKKKYEYNNIEKSKGGGLMDNSVLWQLSYGMYAIGTLDGQRPTGCIVNTVIQITSEKPVIALSMNKNNFTDEAIRRTGRFTVSILSEQTAPNVIACLGFSSGREMDKFAGNVFHWELWEGLPIVTEQAAGYLLGEVIAVHSMETHDIILARLQDAKKGEGKNPMTYQYYHDVIKGKAPKNAPTYQAAEKKENTWVCSVCGYVYEGDLSQEPDSWVCPVCGMPKSAFVRQ